MSLPTTLLLAALLAPLAAAAQSVGINTVPASSAVLDVRATAKGVSFPNLSLGSVTDATTIPSPVAGLMVYNTNAALPCGAGLYFNNGTAAAPAWTCFTKSVQNLHAYDTGGRSTASNVLTLQPGCSLTFTVPSGQAVDIKVDAFIGAIIASVSPTAYSTVDAAIFLDGNFVVRGAYGRLTLENSITAYGQGSTTLSTLLSGVTGGTHTVALYTSVSAGSAVTIGGNAVTMVNAGEINATVYYR